MIKNSTKYFNETLSRGMVFEHGEAITVLHRLFPYCLIMNNQVDPAESTGGKVIGPRLYRGEDREEMFVAPDFVIFNEEGIATWVDAKLKGKSYVHAQNKRQYLTIDKQKQKYYNSFPDWMLKQFFLLFKVESTGKVYLTEFHTEPDTIYFNNQYGEGHTPIYYVDELVDVSDDK